VLNLSGNGIQAEGVQHLTRHLSRPGAPLQALLLAGNPLGDQGCLHVADMLKVRGTGKGEREWQGAVRDGWRSLVLVHQCG
jgi:hypothetical protein